MTTIRSFEAASAWASAICSASATGLIAAEQEARLEQAVRGVDSLDERAVQARIARALAAEGFGVWREERYPRDRTRRKRSEGLRCDLVVTPSGRPLASDEPAPRQPSLFERLEATAARAPCALSEALWLEVKVIAQFGEARPTRGYASLLQRPVWRDAERLAGDETIRHAGQIVVLFTESPEVATHDLDAMAALGRGLGLPIGARVEQRFAVVDRLGNRVCTVALFPVDARLATPTPPQYE